MYNVEKSKNLYYSLTDWREIWHGDAYWPVLAPLNLELQKFRMTDGRQLNAAKMQ